MDWIDAMDWLQLVCWTWVWDLLHRALCLAFPLASFLFTFPRSFFLLSVKIVHQCSLKPSQWSDPCLNVLGASCWIAQTNCCWYEDVGWCLYWAGGLYTWLSISIAKHWMVDLAKVMTLSFVSQFRSLFWVGAVQNMSNISNADFQRDGFTFRISAIKWSLAKVHLRKQSFRLILSFHWCFPFSDPAQSAIKIKFYSYRNLQIHKPTILLLSKVCYHFTCLTEPTNLYPSSFSFQPH